MANPLIPSNDNKIRVAATADDQAVYASDFPILDKSHVKVTHEITSSGARNLLTLTTDYTVSNVGNSTFTVTLTDGAAASIVSGDVIELELDIPIERTTDFQASGALLEDALNNEFDKIIQILQLMDVKFAQDLLLKLQTADLGKESIPAMVADGLLAVNSGNTGFEFKQLADLVASNIAGVNSPLTLASNLLGFSVSSFLTQTFTTSHGSQSRTFQAALDDSVRVSQFTGADGIAKINAAIVAANANGIGNVIVDYDAAGYTGSGHIELKSNVNLVAERKGQLLFPGGSTTRFIRALSTVQDAGIYGFDIDPRDLATSYVVETAGQRITIADNYFHESVDALGSLVPMVETRPSSEDLKVIFNRFSDCYIGVRLHQGIDNAIVAFNKFDDYQRGIYARSSTGTKNLFVIGNKFGRCFLGTSLKVPISFQDGGDLFDTVIIALNILDLEDAAYITADPTTNRGSSDAISIHKGQRVLVAANLIHNAGELAINFSLDTIHSAAIANLCSRADTGAINMGQGTASTGYQMSAIANFCVDCSLDRNNDHTNIAGIFAGQVDVVSIKANHISTRQTGDRQMPYGIFIDDDCTNVDDDGSNTIIGAATSEYYYGTTPANITFIRRDGVYPSSELTIASGAITLPDRGKVFRIDTEADAASDDLDTINGGYDGREIVLVAEDDARTVVLKDATDNIACDGDFSLDNAEDAVTLIYRASSDKWLLKSSSNNGV